MELLFKRVQTTNNMGRVNFKIWGKLEVSEDEQALINRYHFDESVLIGSDDSDVLRRAIKLGAIVFVVAAALLTYMMNGTMGFLGGAAAGAGAGYWLMNEKRETIFVKDLLHGRNFTCDSVVELAKKEAWLEGACAVFRQVMESAKHWDGVERHTIEPLPKEQAKETDPQESPDMVWRVGARVHAFVHGLFKPSEAELVRQQWNEVAELFRQQGIGEASGCAHLVGALASKVRDRFGIPVDHAQARLIDDLIAELF